MYKVRASLRRWLEDRRAEANPQDSLLPEEARDTTSGINNSLTRPEDMANIDLQQTDELSDDVEDALIELDRMAETMEEAPSLPGQLGLGDLVELNFNFAVPVFAVYLGMSDVGFYQFLASNGDFHFTQKLDYVFKSEDFISHKSVERFAPYLPKGATNRQSHYDLAKPAPQNLSGPVISRFIRFQHEAEKFYRKQYAKLDNAHHRLAHPVDMRFMKVEDVAEEILGPPENDAEAYPPHILFAVTNALVKHTFGFVYASPKTFSRNRLLAIYSKEDVGALTRVQESVRAHQEAAALEAGGFAVPRIVRQKASPLLDFAKKAGTIVKYSRTRRKASPEGQILSYRTKDSQQPETQAHDEPSLPQFSPTDTDFIRVLKLQGLTGALSRQPMLRSVPNAIIRVAGDYSGPEIAEKSVMKFLVELGVVDPFYNQLAFDHFVWGPAKDIDRSLAEVDAKVRAGKPLKEAIVMEDSMRDLRKDWGGLLVFCVDDPGAREIDDGFSLEPVPDSDGEVWIHAHVAHVSSTASPDSLFGKLARHRLNSQYLSGGKLGMLPSWLTAEASLAKGKPTLTISTKLDKDCNVLDGTIRAGVIHNVVKVPPSQLDSELFGVEQVQPTESTNLAVGGSMEQSSNSAASTHTLSEEEKTVLKKLASISEKLSERHPAKSFDNLTSATDIHRSSYLASTQEGTQYASVGAIPRRPSFVGQDPFILFRASTSTSSVHEYKSPARTLVEEIMVSAGVTAGRWTSDRGVPIIYNGTQAAVEGIENKLASIRSDMEREATRSSAMSQMYRFYGGAQLSSSPTAHNFLGTAHWAKVTSPLRRFTDLLSHWQIDAALRREAETGQSLVGNKDTSFLPYDQHDIDDIINVLSARQALQREYAASEKKHWRFQFFARAVLLGDVELPRPLICNVQKTGALFTRGMLPLYGMPCFLEPWAHAPDGTSPRPGQMWEVEIDSLNFEKQMLNVSPIRRFERVAEVARQSIPIGHEMPSQPQAQAAAA